MLRFQHGYYNNISYKLWVNFHIDAALKVHEITLVGKIHIIFGNDNWTEKQCFSNLTALNAVVGFKM